MSAYKANRWGRTNRPKAPNNQDGHYVTGSTTAGLLTQYEGTNAPNNAAGIYATENQRYMHIVCSGSDSAVSSVYSYLYATGKWAELQHVDLSDGSRSTIAVAANEHVIVDLKGADLVAVVTGSATKLRYQNFIAFSTF